MYIKKGFENIFVLKSKLQYFKFQTCNLSNLTDHQKKLMAKSLPKQKQLDGVKHIICVASGKGGVGKSTVAVNLATTFANKFNLKTGLLDADIYGPSIPKMMNLSEHQPETNAKNQMIPLRNYNVNCMSMGFLVDQNAAIVWRGLMVMNAIERLLFKVDWSPLDILVIDMPPGTGDVQLSICQNVKLDGSIIVSTPQDIALLDARRSIEMFNKVNVKNLGLIQNMSGYVCSKCGNIDYIFGRDGCLKLANEISTEFLGDIPLNGEIREKCDSGQPISILSTENKISEIYKKICEKILNSLKN